MRPYKAAGFYAYQSGNMDEAARCFDAAVAGNPQDWEGVAALGSVAYENGHLGQALVNFRAALDLERNAKVLADLGRVYAAWGEYVEALKLFEEAYEADPKSIHAANNAAMACINLGRIDDAAKWLTATRENRTLTERLEADYTQVDRNWAYVHLMRQNWAEAWEYFDKGIGSATRLRRDYGPHPLPRWRPEMDRTEKVVIYGEQGLGDELLFGSCIPDVLKHCDNVIIETMPRLVGVFSRSFPEATVYGTRYEKDPSWVAHERPTCRSSMTELPRWFRNSQSEFPGTPYVRPNSAMKAMARGLLAPMPRRRKIGLAWSGGTVTTQWLERQIPIADIMAAFGDIDAEFISLQHSLGEDTPERLGVHVFPMITDRNLDYEWTMALLSELDMVVSVPTAVVHAAGAVGTPTLVMLNEHAQWRCGGPTMPWWGNFEVMRGWTLQSVADRIREVLNGSR